MAIATKIALKPLGNRVIVQRVDEEEEKKHGIIIPDSAKNKHKQRKAKVIAIGSGKRLEDGSTLSIPVKEGDIILMDEYAGQEVTVEDEEYIVLKADDIIALIQE